MDAKQQYVPQSLTQVRTPWIFWKINNFLLSRGSLKTKQKILFFRLLSTMVDAGISISKALGILERQEKKQTFMKHVLQTFQIHIKEGKGFSNCMELFPASFSQAEISMIESWEKTGKINTALKDLSTQIEKIASIQGKFIGALIYPIAIIVIVFGVITVLMTYVVPKLLEIFEDKSKLPGSTQLLIAVSDFFVWYWWLLIGGIIGIIIGIIVWRKTPVGLFVLDGVLLRLPIFGMINQKIILSKFARIFAGMVKSGVSVVEALRITSYAVGNEVYRQRILALREDVKAWLKIHESLEWDPLFPEMMVSMIQIGEQTARIDELILKVADFYEEEVENTINIIHKLLEPFIIVILAVIVGSIVVAIMQPLMNIGDIMSQK